MTDPWRTLPPALSIPFCRANRPPSPSLLLARRNPLAAGLPAVPAGAIGRDPRGMGGGSGFSRSPGPGIAPSPARNRSTRRREPLREAVRRRRRMRAGCTGYGWGSGRNLGPSGLLPPDLGSVSARVLPRSPDHHEVPGLPDPGPLLRDSRTRTAFVFWLGGGLAGSAGVPGHRTEASAPPTQPLPALGPS